ncbi:MAG: hypothetical protein PUB96_08600 [Helicobacteraceae bacterium]|nr:hypothetical protein [Helicobacteraceae bacterium]
MAKIDKIKSKIDTLNSYRNFIITALLAIIGYIFTQYNKAHFVILSCCFVGILCGGVAVFILQKKINKLIDKLEEL